MGRAPTPLARGDLQLSAGVHHLIPVSFITPDWANHTAARPPGSVLKKSAPLTL
jgi:hypothetical protein